jgi:hypothetical protein
VLPGPCVSGCHRSARSPSSLLHPIAAHRAPSSPGPTCQPPCLHHHAPSSSPVAATPVTPVRCAPHAAVEADRSRRVCAGPRRQTPPLRSFSCPHAAPSRTPLPFSSPPAPLSRHKRRCPTPSLISPFFLSSTPVHCASSPTSFPLDAPIHRRRSRGAGPRRIPPERRCRPPSSLSVARSFDLSQPTAPYSLPSSSKLQGHATAVGDHRASSTAAERHRAASPHRSTDAPLLG